MEEFKLETIPFDASYGHTSGAVINVMTRIGTNSYHGSLYDQHQQERWNATPHFMRLAWEEAVRKGDKRPTDPKKPAGRSNIFGATLGGPFTLPKLYSGKNKFFFFFSYSGIYTGRAENPEVSNHTVPKMAWREGDFSNLLAVDAVKYTIYDPRSARLDAGRVVRTPFPGNKGIPVLNPTYQFYAKIYPRPNDVPGLVTPDGFNNFYYPERGSEERFNSLLNRYDYHLSERHRLSARWYWNHRLSRSGDWTRPTMPGLEIAGTTRINKGGGGDYVWTATASHVLNVGASWSRYGEGARRPSQTKFRPSDVGLPAYLDAKAGPYHMLPAIAFSNIQGLGGTYPIVGALGTTATAKVVMTHVVATHSLKYGWEERRYWFTARGPGFSSGRFAFNNFFTREADNTTTASNHAHDWAAFMMGLPSVITIDTNDSGYFSTRYRAFYLHDDWRVSAKMAVNVGLRYEREGGFSERFNRAIAGGFDFDYRPPFATLAEAAYAANQLPELPAGQFKVLGGVRYLGDPYKTFTDGTHHLLPRVGISYQISPTTVLRGGYGWYYDTFNVNNTRPSQAGYNQPTSTAVTNDFGLTICCGVGPVANLSAARNPMVDPFPVRPDGTLFDTPYGNSLGPLIQQGQGWTFTPRDFRPASQQRWRFGIQQAIGGNIVVEVSYNGAHAMIPVTQRVDFLPERYWAKANVRVQAIDDDLNRTVPNPFNIRNLAPLQVSDPEAYRYLSRVGFFTGTVIRKHQLLRAFPNMNGLYGVRPGLRFTDTRGANRYHDLQLQLERRFSAGFHTALMYTRAYSRVQNFYWNEFDARPSWQTNNDVRPHRLAWTGIYELPFGEGQRIGIPGPLRHVLGGWQLSWVYQYQTGPATSWGNRFFYGDINKIGELFKHNEVHSRDIHLWFDPAIAYTGSGPVPAGFQGFEGRAAMQPGVFHVRVFPPLLDALRADGLRIWDAKILKRFAVTETCKIAFSVDLLNLTNHTNFGPPNTNPTDKNFGRVTTQNGLSRLIQLNLRVDF